MNGSRLFLQTLSSHTHRLPHNNNNKNETPDHLIKTNDIIKRDFFNHNRRVISDTHPPCLVWGRRVVASRDLTAFLDRWEYPDVQLVCAILVYRRGVCSKRT